MKCQWLAYMLLGSVSFCVACKGDGSSGSGTSFLEVVETSPENGREDVPVELRIAVRVSEVIDPATLTNQTFFLTDEDGAVVPSTVNVLDEPNAAPSELGTAALLEPDEPLAHTSLSIIYQQKGLVPEAEEEKAIAMRLQMKRQR